MENAAVKITCPICKKEHEAPLHHIVNIQTAPEMKDKLMKEDIFEFQCPDCGFWSQLQYDMLYADPEAKLFIFLSDRKASAESAMQAVQTVTGSGDVPADAIIRIVYSPEDLREKIRIFDHGLDDRIVEIYKGFSVSQFDYSENYYITDIRYDLIDGKEFFRIRVSDGTEQYVLDFNSGYEQILNEYIEKIPPMRSRVPACVDLEYAAAIVRGEG